MDTASVMQENIISAAALIFLGIEAAADYRKKSVSLLFCIIFCAAALIYNIGLRGVQTMWLLTGAVPGLLVVAASLITRQQIGSGDGAVLICLGLCLGGEAVLITFLLAGMSAAAVSLLLLATGRIKRGYQMAFVPFLLAGYVEVLLCG